MNDYCPDCGEKLRELRIFHPYWLRFLQCPQCNHTYFLEVNDSRWIYPLLRLNPGIGIKLLTLEDDLLRTASERIRYIDYKTVSIVDFEHTILGCYDQTDN